MCRECIREDEELNSKIELTKKKEHFICNRLFDILAIYSLIFIRYLTSNLVTVESVGIYEPHEIVKEAIQILKQKASNFILNLK